MSETPWNRYMRRKNDEVQPLLSAAEWKQNEISKELDAAQKVCHHVDDGGFMYATCKLCGKFDI